MSFTILKQILERVLREQDFKGDIEAYRVFAEWPEIVGPKVAGHTRCARMADKVLYVEVDDHLWLAQLKYMKTDMLRKIDRAIKPGLFRDLKFFLKSVQ
jgi:predicted nucleic acid-binding Zn ribbon protein